MGYNMKLFTKKDRSTFPYWFAHWCAFQMTACLLHVWKPRYLLHDIEKPWLRLFWSYKRVQKWHRIHNRHHLKYGELHGYNKMDWEATIIDWECSRFTKESSPKTARQEANYLIYGEGQHPELIGTFNYYVFPLLDKLGL